MKIEAAFLFAVLGGLVARAGEVWVDFSALTNAASYRAVSGVEGVSGALPAGWRDGSSWSGAQVTYAFAKEGSSGYLHVEVKGEGMCQFSNPAVPALDRLGCFNLIVRGRSATGSDVIIGLRDTEGEHAYAVTAKIPLGPEWKDYVIPVSGGPAARTSVFHVELFSPGSADLAALRLEKVPADRYVPLTARAVAREDAWWQERNRQLVEAAASGQPALMIMGDSITQRWEQNGKEAWEKSIAPFRASNFGIDGDGTEHLLWRIRHSGLGTRFKPRLVALLVGVNNIGAGVMPNDVVLGLGACIQAVQAQSPGTTILILGVFPAAQSGEDGVRETIRAVNRGYAALADNRRVFFADIGGAFLERDGSLSATIMDDFLHLTPTGYGLYAQALVPVVQKLLAGKP